MDQKYLLFAVILLISLFAVFFIPHNLNVNDLTSNSKRFNGKLVLVNGEVNKVNCIKTSEDASFVSCALALRDDSNSVFLLNRTKTLKCSGTPSKLNCDIEPGNYTFSGIFLVKNSEFYLDIKQIL